MWASRRSRTFRTALLVTLAISLAVSLGGCSLSQRLTRNESDSGSTSGSSVTPLPPDSTGAQSGGGDSAVSKDSLGAYSPGTEGSLISPPASGTDAATVPAEQRLIVRNVGVRVRVKDVANAVTDLQDAAKRYQAIVTDLQVSTDEGVPIYRSYTEATPLADGAALSGYMTVRVPAAKLDAFVAEASKLGTVLRQAESESDVTQQHIDLKARLVNLKATEAQLREFFGKAKNVTEMLAIEQELSRVRGEIEAMQAQIDYLERQASLATVTVELTGPAPVVRPAGEDWGFVDALTQSLRAFVGTVNALIIIVGGIAPLVLIGLAVFFPARALWRRRRHANKEQ